MLFRSGFMPDRITFTLQRASDSKYWNGSSWVTALTRLTTTHSASSGSTSIDWTSSSSLPTWSGEAEGSYTIQARSRDKYGNLFSGTAVTFTLDKTAPTVSSIVPALTPTNGATASFTVTFGEIVTGGSASSFSLTTSGITGASVTGVTGSGATRTVTVNTGTGDGTIRLDLTTVTGIADAAGNALVTTYSSGTEATIEKTAPVGGTVSISASASTMLVSGTTIYVGSPAANATFAVTYTGITETGSGISSVTCAAVAGFTPVASGTGMTRTCTYTATGTGYDATGTSTTRTSTATDVAGNTGNLATFTTIRDATAPTTTFTTPAATVYQSTTDYTVAWTETEIGRAHV